MGFLSAVPVEDLGDSFTLVLIYLSIRLSYRFFWASQKRLNLCCVLHCCHESTKLGQRCDSPSHYNYLEILSSLVDCLLSKMRWHQSSCKISDMSEYWNNVIITVDRACMIVHPPFWLDLELLLLCDKLHFNDCIIKINKMAFCSSLKSS